MIILTFVASGFASRDDANRIATVTLTVTNEEKHSLTTHAKHEKAIFSCCILRIKKLKGELVIENRLCVIEGNAVLLQIRSRLD